MPDAGFAQLEHHDILWHDRKASKFKFFKLYGYSTILQLEATFENWKNSTELDIIRGPCGSLESTEKISQHKFTGSPLKGEKVIVG